MEHLPEITGLTAEQAEEKRLQGLGNEVKSDGSLTTKEIILSNTLTYFNLIFAVITVLLCMVGSWRNLTFLPVVLANMLIGIIQELRAKKVLDEMKLLQAPHAMVLRDGKLQKIQASALVKEDVIFLSAGDQICADAKILDGTVQVNEALLTGESDEIEKTAGAKLLSGSFVVSGSCYAKLTAVGSASYAAAMEKEAKAMQKTEQSEMIRSINRIVKWMGILVIPIGALLFYSSYVGNHETVQRSVTSTVAAIIGMIPEGLYLLTTAALALGTIRLARRKVLLHDMKSIETLARVDVLCVDKTGTITKPQMQVEKMIVCPETSGAFEKLLDYIEASQDNNATMQALKDYAEQQKQIEGAAKEKTQGKPAKAGKPGTTEKSATLTQHSRRHALKTEPFRSKLKYGRIFFEEETLVLGAPEILLGDRYSEWKEQIEPEIRQGYRVVLLGTCPAGTEASVPVTPYAFFVLSNPIRENAQETFSYFREQGVRVIVISGDHPETVSKVAVRAGIDGAQNWVDASTLHTAEQLGKAVEHTTVFGRVTPQQKKQLVKALQQQGHTVAMTGDGVNDILAMKDADCSVAMASGCEAAAQAAQVVLMDSDFSRMPDVVLEGRRVVNNVQRSAVLFLVKNIFSLLMAVFAVSLGITYPLEPSQVSLISMFTIGLPGFLLALEPNREKIQGKFIQNVLLRALPAGLTDVLAVGALVACGQIFGLKAEDVATAATLLLAVVGFMILIKISVPFNRLKAGVLAVSIFGLILFGTVGGRLFAMSEMSGPCIMLLVMFGFSAESLFRYLTKFAEFLAKA